MATTMNRLEYVVAHLGIAAVLLGSAAALIGNAEMFPFSSYPMYSAVSRVPVQLGRVVGVVRDSEGEREVPFEADAQVYPFSARTLRSALARILRDDGREVAARALRDELDVYNERAAMLGGPVLERLRYYTMVLEPAASGELTARPGALLIETR